jgi:hypothetical protein
MNLESITTRAMELVGVRSLSVFAGKVFGQPHPPSLGSKEPPRWTKADYVGFRQDARYYLISNAIRAGLTAPLVYATAQIGAGWIVDFMGLVLILHLLIVVVEGYRLGLARELEPKALPTEPNPSARKPAPVTFKTRGYFRPRAFENEPLYRFLGVEWFRRIVVWYGEVTKLSAEDRERGEEVRYVEHAGLQEVVQFESTTRTAEAIHLICALWNLPALWVLVLAGSPWTPVAAALFLLDAYLVLLQRYHRSRVWVLIQMLIERNVSRHHGRDGNASTAP